MKKTLITACIISMGFWGGKALVSAEEKVTDEEQKAEQQTAAPKKAVSGLEVSTFILCEGVEEREPIGENKIFPPEIGKVFFLTTITGAQEPTQIKHVWYYKGNQMADITLNILYARHRTWSYKTIIPEWTGNWSVEVLDSNAIVIKKANFVIGTEPEKKETPKEEIQEEPTQEKE